MQQAAAWAGPRFQLTHSAAKGSGERLVLCSACGVLLEVSETRLPSAAAQGQCQGLQTGSNLGMAPGPLLGWECLFSQECRRK